MKQLSIPGILLSCLLLTGVAASAQTTVKRVVLQGFWWDYYNNNYPFKWADYLAELAPRLKALGVDAVWIPPTPKNAHATNDVGYAPFDQYDLGDKYQKGATRTRFGSKDEFLRLVAVLHANGIEVVQDVVLNHTNGAGTTDGTAGQDPETTYSMASSSGYKNFRYSSFATPLPEAGDNGPAYVQRTGRWPKNYLNFHPQPGHNTTSGDLAAPYFGPDFCYGNDGGNDGYGGVSAAYLALYPSTYNPAQTAGYSQTQARSWIVWMKQQTGVDGFRWDAVKHFSYNTQQDLSYNLKYNALWANGGEKMFNVGEFVGSSSDMDSYVSSVTSQNGGTDFLMGTFDFNLRSAIYSMVSGNGGYDLSQIPGQQQSQRVAYYSGSNTYVHRTAPFVNNHDTFRPQLDASGNYTGWNTGDELAAHIDPFDARLSAAYAIAMAVDGNPHIYFEDLFNLGSTGKRYSHLPASAADLPTRDDLVNLLWCHQHLGFKDGAYKVRYQSADHLVIERGAKAIIGINDNYSTWQANYVDSDFAPGTVLRDYSGANGTATYTVPADQRVLINTPPCNGTALLGRRGYSVWAPVGQDASTYTPPRATATSQQWEMADDLGDLNCQSLGQGGRLPDNSANRRLVGKIYALAGQPVTYELYPESAPNTRSLTVGVYDLHGNLLSTASGTASATGTYTPATTGWLALKVQNTYATYAGQRCYLKATYTAPTTVDTRNAPAPLNKVAIWTGNNTSTDPTDCRNWENGVLPSATTDVLVPAGSTLMPSLATGILAAHDFTIEPGATVSVQAGTTLRIAGNFTNQGTLGGAGRVLFDGSVAQTISGPTAFAGLTISNSSDVTLLSPVSVSDTLALRAGHLVADNQALSLGAAATVAGAAASRYVVVRDAPAGLGYVLRPVPATSAAVSFPVGTAAGYAPVTLRNSGAAASVKVRTFGGVLAHGTSGAPYASAASFVGRSWELSPVGAGAVVDATLQWNGAEENSSFQRANAAVYHNDNTPTGTWASLPGTAPTGTNPYQATATGVSGFSTFAVGSTTPLPVELLSFGAQRVSATAVVVAWATASEVNCDHFEVERSADGRQFGRVGSVACAGGSQRHAYTLRDEAATSAAYYRLRQADADGQTHYSAVVYVAAPAGSSLGLSAFPNPTTGTVTLAGLPAATTLTLSLTNALGQVLLPACTAPLPAATDLLNAALAPCAPGVYVLTAESNGQRQHLKVVKE
ncbi:MAG: alpha-amylase family glycosyl hydrolase [Janthinobacterium lividum]